MITMSLFHNDSFKVQAEEVLVTEQSEEPTSEVAPQSQSIVEPEPLAVPAVYSVKRIDAGGNFSESLFDTENFVDANQKMIDEAKNVGPNVVVVSSKSFSPLKIVAADRAMVHSYPYRVGQPAEPHLAPGVTMYLYNNANLGASLSYVPAHYKMFYEKTELNKRNNLVAKMNLQGVNGYIDLNKTDIIPMIFIENGIPILIGGNEENYNSPEKSYTKVLKPDVYEVVYDSANNFNEIKTRYEQTFLKENNNELIYGVAPEWLKPGVYFSPDGIKFFTDIDLRNPVMNGNVVGEHYAYFQWLPIRTTSNFTAEDFTNDLIRVKRYDESVIKGNENAFIENGNQFGMNSLLVYAQGALESGYGTSKYARERFNLFGVDAVDSNPDNAGQYSSPMISVRQQMNFTLRAYLSLDDWRFSGYSYGNMGSGISTRYASDPFYGIKIASVAYRADKAVGFKDINKIELGKITDDLKLNIRKEPSLSSGSYYTTLGGKFNQIVPLYEESNGFYRSNITQPLVNGEVVKYVGSTKATHYNLDLNSTFGYLSSDPKHVQKITSGTVPVIFVGRIGDVDADGDITLIDLALIKSHLLDNNKLVGEELFRADVDKDRDITLIDLATVKAHLLGNLTLE